MVNIFFLRINSAFRLLVFMMLFLGCYIEVAADELCAPLPDELSLRYGSYDQFQARNQLGRQISWSRVGASNQRIVFYAHGNPGSRFEALFFHDYALSAGITLYVLERPGFGCSDYKAEYSLSDYAEDTKWLYQRLGLNQPVSLMGWSSGGPPSLAVASYYPALVRRVVVASSYSNFGEMPSAKALMKQYHRPGPLLSDKTPRLFHGLISMVGWASHKLPNVYFKVTEQEVSLSDRTILEQPGVKGLFLLNQEEAFAQGAHGAIQDLTTQWQPWPFGLRDVSSQVLLVQGGEDKLVPKEFVFHMAQAIPGAQLEFLSSEGHLYPLSKEYQKVLLGWLIED